MASELTMLTSLPLQTPKDKLACISRCASTIMNLLRMANEKSVPAADDFTPVFIFVIIKGAYRILFIFGLLQGRFS